MKRVFLAIALLTASCIVTPARAADVDFSTIITDQNGRPYDDCQKWDISKSPPFCEASKPQTLGGLVVQALNKQEPGMPITDLMRRGNLALRIAESKKPLFLGVDDLKLIKDAMEKMGATPVAMVRAMTLLDPDSVKK